MQIVVGGGSAYRHRSVNVVNGFFAGLSRVAAGSSVYDIGAFGKLCDRRCQRYCRRSFVNRKAKELLLAGLVFGAVAGLGVKASACKARLSYNSPPACNLSLVSVRDVGVSLVGRGLVIRSSRGSRKVVHRVSYGWRYFCFVNFKSQPFNAAQSVARRSVKNHVVFAVAYGGSVCLAKIRVVVRIIFCLKGRLVFVFLDLEWTDYVALVSGNVNSLNVKVVVIRHRLCRAFRNFNYYFLKACRRDQVALRSSVRGFWNVSAGIFVLACFLVLNRHISWYDIRNRSGVLLHRWRSKPIENFVNAAFNRAKGGRSLFKLSGHAKSFVPVPIGGASASLNHDWLCFSCGGGWLVVHQLRLNAVNRSHKRLAGLALSAASVFRPNGHSPLAVAQSVRLVSSVITRQRNSDGAALVAGDRRSKRPVVSRVAFCHGHVFAVHKFFRCNLKWRGRVKRQAVVRLKDKFKFAACVGAVVIVVSLSFNRV